MGFRPCMGNYGGRFKRTKKTPSGNNITMLNNYERTNEPSGIIKTFIPI